MSYNDHSTMHSNEQPQTYVMQQLFEEKLHNEIELVHLFRRRLAEQLTPDYDQLLALIKESYLTMTREVQEANAHLSPEQQCILAVSFNEASRSLCWKIIALAIGELTYGETWSMAMTALFQMRDLFERESLTVRIRAQYSDEGEVSLVLDHSEDTPHAQRHPPFGSVLGAALDAYFSLGRQEGSNTTPTAN